ncbi:MAG: tRNA uridine-5-carboxymethylaminomethyl(34) synthesis GTPase MnmE [Bacteroidales bacterium]|nr:tRNA uridine-5-carboxymethylaminomethyl(34) synthesis GTPase MnmE [Bacteroidales bacterium]
MRNDTIAAVSTPAGMGGVAVLRVSGAGALDVVLPLLEPATPLPPRRASLRTLAGIDQGLAVYLPAPNSYTGEDTVELSCHGSLYVQQALLQALLDAGARLAEPGEFTRRAFLNGRLNLSQAEAVADLIEAATPTQHRLATSQLRGAYANELKALRQQLVDLTSLMELELDFSQEDVEFADRGTLLGLVTQLQDRVQGLLGSFATGNALKRGVPVAILGRPNAGKSTLLNALLGDERAIVSPIPGTTRDTIEETMTIDGITFRFIDTAGLRQSDDALEALGIERSIKAARQATILLYVRNITMPFDDYALTDITDITDECDMRNKHIFFVHNKCDLPHKSNPPGHIVSAKEGIGIDSLKESMVAVIKNDAAANDGVLISNLRHYEALGRTRDALRHVAEGLERQMPADLVAVDLRDALYHLGSITGDVTSNELLQNIFSRFCVGK